MPCYLFTYHAYGSWMPDREEGFVRRKIGVLTPDVALAEEYRERSNDSEATFLDSVQLTIIEEVLTACEFQRYRPHYVTTDTSHVHVLVSWKIDRNWSTVRNGIKQSLSRRLNRDVERRTWLAEGASRKRVKDDEHFNHLIANYLPSHRGWKWREGVGYFR